MVENTVTEANKDKGREADRGKDKDKGQWEIVRIEDKRKIKGLKCKIKWGGHRNGGWLIIRAVFTENYKERLDDADFLVELDSSNIDIPFDEQREIQSRINKAL